MNSWSAESWSCKSWSRVELTSRVGTWDKKSHCSQSWSLHWPPLHILDHAAGSVIPVLVDSQHLSQLKHLKERRVHSVSIMTDSAPMHTNARIHATGQTGRPNASGEKCPAPAQVPVASSMFLTQKHTHTITHWYRFKNKCHPSFSLPLSLSHTQTWRTHSYGCERNTYSYLR